MMNSDDSESTNVTLPSEVGVSPEPESRRYWRTAISHLSDPQKRDAAWEFYLRRLESRKSGDTLSALVLLMEANGAFLDPLTERLATMRSNLANQEENQREMVAVLEKAAKINASTNARSISVLGTAEGALRKAASCFDAGSVVREVKSQIDEEALQPFKRVLKDLAASAGSIREATNTAEDAVEKWRRVNLGGITATLLGLMIIGSIVIVAWFKHGIQQDYEQRFTAALMQLDTSRKALSKLAEIGVGVRVLPSADGDGKTIQGGYAVVIDGAESADIRDVDGHRLGVVFGKAAEILPPSRKTGSLSDKPLTR
jgi:hypothetical protein